MGSCCAVCEPPEFFVVDETELDITATEEARDKLLWHVVVEDVLPNQILELGILLMSAGSAQSPICVPRVHVARVP